MGPRSTKSFSTSLVNATAYVSCYLFCAVKVTSDAAEIAEADRIVVPGQGAARDCMGELNRLNYPFSLTGTPAISIPCGFTQYGLPIGLQIIGRHFDEETVLRMAWNYESNSNWQKMRPQV